MRVLIQQYSCFLSFGETRNDVSVMGELPNQRVHLLQGNGRQGAPFEVAPDEAVGGHTHFERRQAGVFHPGLAKISRQSEDAEHSSHPCLPLATVNFSAELADALAGPPGAREKLERRGRHFRGPVLCSSAKTPPTLPHVLSKKLAGARL